MRIAFYVEHSYYWPQFQPVAEFAVQAKAKVTLLCGISVPAGALAGSRSLFDFVSVESHEEVAVWTRNNAPDWLIAGNGLSTLKNIVRPTRTALMMHGTDVSFKRACEVPALKGFDVRFVGSPGRTQTLKELYPETEMVETGYAKLSSFFPLRERAGSNNQRPKILYAPTFYPSSLLKMPVDWPGKLAGCDITIKPHQFTLSKSRYKTERETINRWSQYPNVSVVFNMESGFLDSMLDADLMVSDASSASFEFAALEKPVLIADFPRLRWTYRGPLAYRYKRRMAASLPPEAQLFTFVHKPAALVAEIRNQLEKNPLNSKPNWEHLVRSAVGPRDGEAPARIFARLMQDD